jgi:hypothetical protein
MICRFYYNVLHTICRFCSAVCTHSAGSFPAVCTWSAGFLQLSAHNHEHVLVVMPVFHPRARSILGPEVETGFINCSVSSYRCRIIPYVLCFRATVARSEQDEEQLRYTDAPFFVLRISPQRFVSATLLLLSWMSDVKVYNTVFLLPRLLSAVSFGRTLYPCTTEVTIVLALSRANLVFVFKITWYISLF